MTNELNDLQFIRKMVEAAEKEAAAEAGKAAARKCIELVNKGGKAIGWTIYEIEKEFGLNEHLHGDNAGEAGEDGV
jgi:hypothetical protein